MRQGDNPQRDPRVHQEYSVATLATAANTVGRCHLCQDPENVPIVYCDSCDHWFCQGCQNRWFARGVEFLKQLTGGRNDGCCGPR